MSIPLINEFVYSLNELLTHTRKDGVRLEFLSRISDAIGESDKDLQSWCHDWLENSFHSVTRLEAGDEVVLVHLAGKHGHLSFVRDRYADGL
jgi:hypothetical protein